MVSFPLILMELIDILNMPCQQKIHAHPAFFLLHNLAAYGRGDAPARSAHVVAALKSVGWARDCAI